MKRVAILLFFILLAALIVLVFFPTFESKALHLSKRVVNIYVDNSFSMSPHSDEVNKAIELLQNSKEFVIKFHSFGEGVPKQIESPFSLGYNENSSYGRRAMRQASASSSKNSPSLIISDFHFEDVFDWKGTDEVILFSPVSNERSLSVAFDFPTSELIENNLGEIPLPYLLTKNFADKIGVELRLYIDEKLISKKRVDLIGSAERGSYTIGRDLLKEPQSVKIEAVWGTSRDTDYRVLYAPQNKIDVEVCVFEPNYDVATFDLVLSSWPNLSLSKHFLLSPNASLSDFKSVVNKRGKGALYILFGASREALQYCKLENLKTIYFPLAQFQNEIFPKATLKLSQNVRGEGFLYRNNLLRDEELNQWDRLAPFERVVSVSADDVAANREIVPWSLDDNHSVLFQYHNILCFGLYPLRNISGTFNKEGEGRKLLSLFLYRMVREYYDSREGASFSQVVKRFSNVPIPQFTKEVVVDEKGNILSDGKAPFAEKILESGFYERVITMGKSTYNIPCAAYITKGEKLRRPYQEEPKSLLFDKDILKKRYELLSENQKRGEKRKVEWVDFKILFFALIAIFVAFALFGGKYIFKIFWIALLFSASPLLYSSSYDFTFTVLQYSGGGDWYEGKVGAPNLIKFIEETTKIKCNPTINVVAIDDARLGMTPFVYMTGHGDFLISKSEAKYLRSYLENGGFLFANDDYGLDPFFREAMKVVYPERELVELPLTHPIFTIYHSFPQGLPKIHEHDGKRPQLFAIYSGKRIVVLYSYESDIGDGWAPWNVHKTEEEKRTLALKFGVNIVLFSMCQ